jgi:hypothetical protein
MFPSEKVKCALKDMCPYAFLNVNPMVGVLGAHALKGKKTAFVS